MDWQVGDKVVVRLGVHRGTAYGWFLPPQMVPDGTETEIVSLSEFKDGWVRISACSNSYYPMSLLFPINKKIKILQALGALK